MAGDGGVDGLLRMAVLGLAAALGGLCAVQISLQEVLRDVTDLADVDIFLHTVPQYRYSEGIRLLN